MGREVTPTRPWKALGGLALLHAVDPDRHVHADRLTVQQRGIELPSPHGVGGGGTKLRRGGRDDAHIADVAVLVDRSLHEHETLGPSRVHRFRILWFDV